MRARAARGAPAPHSRRRRCITSFDRLRRTVEPPLPPHGMLPKHRNVRRRRPPATARPRPAGMLPEPHNTPPCNPALLSLRALLTESLAARLAAPEPQPLLSVLNSSSVETAHVIWNASMREELLKVCGGRMLLFCCCHRSKQHVPHPNLTLKLVTRHARLARARTAAASCFPGAPAAARARARRGCAAGLQVFGARGGAAGAGRPPPIVLP